MRFLSFGLLVSFILHILLVIFIFSKNLKEPNDGGYAANDLGALSGAIMLSNLPPQKVVPPSKKVEPKPEIKEPPKVKAKEKIRSNLSVKKPKEIKKEPKIKPKEPEPDLKPSNENSESSNLVAASAILGSGTTSKAPILGVSNIDKVVWESLVLAHLNKYKKYPKKAVLKRQEGVIVVKITLNKNGNVLKVELSKPSKFKVLNDEVLALVKRANPIPKPDLGLFSGESLTIRIPIKFNIREYLKR